MTNPFTSMVEDLKNLSKKKPTITYEQYEQFKKEFVFEKLKGKRFGKAFCEKFSLHDYVLSNMISDDEVDTIIRLMGYIK